MKNITESLNEIQNITPYLKGEEKIDEGLKDIFKVVKDVFKHAFQYLKGVVAKIGTYFIPADENGKLLNVISPLTAGSAYVDGSIDRKSTLVKMDKAGAKITGCKTKFDDAIKLYGYTNTFTYWYQCLNENTESNYETIVESAKTINEVKRKRFFFLHSPTLTTDFWKLLLEP